MYHEQTFRFASGAVCFLLAAVYAMIRLIKKRAIEFLDDA
jgi:hypothetical protein